MGRTKSVTPFVPAATDEEIAASDPTFRAMQAEADGQYDAATDLAQTLSYDGPLTVPALMDGIRMYQRRTVDDCLELGKRLCLLKQVTGHGNFSQALGVLGIATRTAERFMGAALKTAKSANLAHLAKAATSVSRMLEYLTLDDDEAAALRNGGEVGGITYDQADLMTATQLRAHWRESRQVEAAKDSVLAEKSAKIDKLATEVAKLRAERDQQSLLIQVAVADPDEQRAQLLGELLRRTAHAEIAIVGDLRIILKAVREHADSTGLPADDAIAGAMGQLRRALAEVEFEFDVKAAPDGALLPEASIWDAVGVSFDRAQAGAVDPADTAIPTTGERLDS